MDLIASGVLDLEVAAGPVAALDLEVAAADVSNAVLVCGRSEEAAGVSNGGPEVAVASEGNAFGVESWLFASSFSTFSCSVLTLRVKASTFAVNFFFSLLFL